MNRYTVNTCLVMVIAPAIVGFAAQTTPSSVQTLIHNWKTLQDTTETIDITWEAECFVRSAPVAPGHKTGSRTYPRRVRLVLDRAYRGRVERYGESAFSDVEQSLTQVCDGQELTRLYSSGAVGFPNAHVSHAAIDELLCHKRMVPLRLVYRPFDPRIGLFNSTALSVSADRAVVEDEQMVVLVQKGSREKVVWLDPSKMYLPRKYLEIVDGTVAWEFDVAYSEDPVHGWVLSSWELAWLTPNAEIRQSDSARVVDYIINAPVVDESFQVAIPTGTYVQSSIEKMGYILKNDGSKRIVRAGEWAGDVINSSRRRPNAWLVIVVCVIIVFVCVFGFRRWSLVSASQR